MEGLEGALDELAEQGLNLLGFVPVEAGPGLGRLPARPGVGLLVLLSAGSRFGAGTDYGAAGGDPFDERAAALAGAFAARWLRPGDPATELVYPGDAPLDLRGWLEAGRVQARSRLGIGIRPDCGTWLAVRAALWTSPPSALRAAVTRRYPPLPEGAAPCASCDGAPCQRACPAGAVALGDGGPGARELEACMAHRLAEGSSCADRCLARLRCPVGAQARYPEAQLRYHYGRSLVSLRRYRRQRAGG